MVASTVPAPNSPTLAALFDEFINYPIDSTKAGTANVDKAKADSYAAAAGTNVTTIAKVTKICEKELDEPERPTFILDAEETFPVLYAQAEGKDVGPVSGRASSIEAIERPANWRTPVRLSVRVEADKVVAVVNTPVKIESVSPDLGALKPAAVTAAPATPPAPTSGLGKHEREDTSTPIPTPTAGPKKRRVRKAKSLAPRPILPSPTPATQSDARTLMSKSPSEAMLWDSILSPSSSTMRALDDSAAAVGGQTQQPTAEGPLECKGCVEVEKAEAGWTELETNGRRLRHMIMESPRSNTLVLNDVRDEPVRSTPVASHVPDTILSPQPLYPGQQPVPNATILQDSDVTMRSPSPTITQILRDRIPRHAKGKGVDHPVAGPSRPERLVDSFYLQQTAEPRHRTPLFFNPDDTTCSVYPPPQHPARPSPRTHTPVHPASIIDRFQLFESTMASRGPPISKTLYAQEFPAQMANSPRQSPIPPRPYIEDGEIGDDHVMDASGLRDFVQQQAENAPAEQDEFLTIMPQPQGGFPTVHFSTPLGAYSNTMDRQLLDWERERRSGLVALGVSFYGFGALDGDVDPRYRQLLSYAAHTLNARFHTDRIMIAKPQPKAPVSQLNAAPHTALLYGLRKDEAQILEQEGVMCTTRLAMFFHKLDVAFPEYVGAIHGLTTRLIQPVYEMVLSHFLSPEAESLFQNLACKSPNPIVLPSRAQSYHLNTLYVRRLDCRARGNTHAPVFLVYMRSPATDYHSFREWTAFCRKINLTHSLYGTGYLKSPGICAGCHGHDHPSGLCRFARLEGWLAPPPNSTPNFSIPPPPPSSENPPGQGRVGNASSSQARPRRRRGNGRQTHVDSPRP